MGPCPQPFISADWYMGLLWGCCCIMGFWGPTIRPDIILLGGLLPVPTNEGSPCWPIPAITKVTFPYNATRKSRLCHYELTKNKVPNLMEHVLLYFILLCIVWAFLVILHRSHVRTKCVHNRRHVKTTYMHKHSINTVF